MNTPTDDQPNLEQEEPPKESSFLLLCIKIVAAVFVMALGAGYGIASYKVFASIFSRPTHGASGLMLVSFLAGIPLAIGLLVGYFAKQRRIAGMAGSSGLSVLAIALFIFAAGAILREGVICIVMATPFFIVLAIIGAAAGSLLSVFGGPRSPKLLSVALVLPLLAAPIEDRLSSGTEHLVSRQSIYIAAAPEIVWQHINFPININPAELRGGFAYSIGVPYPIEARTHEGRVGGTRTLIWERGVQFKEIITAWEPNRHIAWRYQFGPASFPPGSLDDHIVIGGRYFNLSTTSYTLAPEGNGTRLSIVVGTSVTTNFNWYAELWARFLVEDTSTAILRFYKVRSEKSASNA